MLEIQRVGNKIAMRGRIGFNEFRRIFATLHTTITQQGYSDLVLDYSDIDSAFSGPMLALCSQVSLLRRNNIDVSIVLPKNETLNRLFINTNWAHLLDPRQFDPTNKRRLNRIPATPFVDSSEQGAAVNALIDAVLSSATLERESLRAVEWALSEITDNVLNHANSKVGGLVQLSMLPAKNRIEFCVGDAGRGIPQTLREAHPALTSDVEALERAIREGYTRAGSFQGNGLYGSFRACEVSEGYFHIHAGYAYLDFDKPNGIHVRTSQVPISGTLVVVCIDYSKKDVLDKALEFKGKVHQPIDYIELKYESGSTEEVTFRIKDECSSVGSRIAGKPVATKLSNLLGMCKPARVSVDFSEIPLISSSFADEVFGKLFLRVGPLEFMGRLKFNNTSSTVKNLIDRAITQRVANPHMNDADGDLS